MGLAPEPGSRPGAEETHEMERQGPGEPQPSPGICLWTAASGRKPLEGLRPVALNEQMPRAPSFRGAGSPESALSHLSQATLTCLLRTGGGIQILRSSGRRS